MLCHKCPHNGKFVGVAWEETPCSKCHLRMGSSHTREYSEDILDEENPGEPEAGTFDEGESLTFDEQEYLPFDDVVGNDDEPMIPLSVLGQAMACWVSLSLPAREVFKMRMANKSLSEISAVLGVCKTTVFNVIDQAIKENPVMASIANGKADDRKAARRIKRVPQRKLSGV